MPPWSRHGEPPEGVLSGEAMKPAILLILCVALGWSLNYGWRTDADRDQAWKEANRLVRALNVARDRRNELTVRLSLTCNHCWHSVKGMTTWSYCCWCNAWQSPDQRIEPAPEDYTPPSHGIWIDVWGWETRKEKS